MERLVDKFNDNFKKVDSVVDCPICGERMFEYATRGYGNEDVTIHVRHYPDTSAFDKTCMKRISLLDAHMIEASATRKISRRDY